MTNASDIVTAQDFSWAAVDKQGLFYFEIIFLNAKKTGLIVVLIFYVIIASVGMWAAWKHKTGEGRGL